MRSWIDRFLAVVGALLFMQIPLFFVQYQQQLTGRVAELNWQVSSIEKSALKSDKTLSQYILKFKESKDPDVSEEGTRMQKIATRHEKMQRAHSALRHATALTRPFKFLFYMQGDVVKSTLISFTPGIPFSLEGALWALVGMLFGCLTLNITSKIFKIS